MKFLFCWNGKFVLLVGNFFEMWTFLLKAASCSKFKHKHASTFISPKFSKIFFDHRFFSKNYDQNFLLDSVWLKCQWGKWRRWSSTLFGTETARILKKSGSIFTYSKIFSGTLVVVLSLDVTLLTSKWSPDFWGANGLSLLFN